APRGGAEIELGRGTHLGGADRDELERPVAVGEAVALLVGAVEDLREIAPERDGQLERLAAVAQVRLARRGQLAGLLERHDVRPHVDAALVARNETERTQDSGGLRDEDGADLEVVRKRAGV